MFGLQIKKATLIDVEELQKISIETFIETFSEFNSKTDMNIYVAQNLSKNKLIEELKHQQSSFYFATINDVVVGYLKINFSDAQTELKNKDSMEIERIYVLKNYQKKNIGQLLFKTAIETATKKKLKYVWLGVWEKNQQAINFYTKNNFAAFDKHTFVLGIDEQTDIMIRYKITY